MASFPSPEVLLSLSSITEAQTRKFNMLCRVAAGEDGATIDAADPLEKAALIVRMVAGAARFADLTSGGPDPAFASKQSTTRWLEAQARKDVMCGVATQCYENGDYLPLLPYVFRSTSDTADEMEVDKDNSTNTVTTPTRSTFPSRVERTPGKPFSQSGID
ncbi:hypothetical protein BXZ70DRAFT_1010930 [Cristinia sonorae]|uniref:Uncharacterized protein n=1 Tax=Cristinia sonorae TaxID=1940300 RepID=A0A8K0UHK8_9AGAR|nr:hypothetical protein BXZ70DRAFT_1010930 [Cristinia sonorae]